MGVSSLSKIIAVTPTIKTVAYTAKDAVGGRLDFDKAKYIGGGIIQSVTIIDDKGESAELDIVFFDRAFTATPDADIFAPSDADLENCLGVVTVLAGDYKAFDDNSVATVIAGLVYTVDPNETNFTLYAQLVCRGTPTYTATTDLTVKIGLLVDH